MTPAACMDTTCSNAFRVDCGEPSVLMALMVQPSRLACDLSRSAIWLQSADAQLMKATVLPLGIGFPTGVVKGNSVGWASKVCNTALAEPASEPAFDEPDAE